MANLLEAYKGRMAIAEKVFAKSHAGEKLSESKKLMIATCLKNVNSLMNEAFDASMGTQRSDMGMFKKFALNLTNVALPNLIGPDIVLTYPMTAMSGYINYIEYVAASTKGATKQGDLLNSPFALGDVDVNYTSSRVVDEVVASNQTVFPLKWNSVVPGTVDIVAGSTRFVDDGKGGLLAVAAGSTISRRTITESEENGVVSGTPVRVEVVVTTAGGQAVAPTVGASVIYGKHDAGFASADDAIKAAGAGITLASGVTGDVVIKYSYNNVVIPQNEIPALKAEVKMMPLLAKARRIAIYYSQIAAFQAKTDYGMDLGQQLAEKAVGQLTYEIDTEICQMLIDNADEDQGLVWSKTPLIGVSKQDHYAAFTEVIDQGSTIIYNRTRKFAPNYMLVARNVLNVLQFIPSFQAAPQGVVNGPYFAGTVSGIKVYVSPAMEPGRFVLGVNGNDAMTSAAVYAPYMPIVPTQLLGHADGSMSQGWSTLYDLRLLNKSLLVSGRITA